MMGVSEILRQDTGRFDRRYQVGPACWPFWDLLWVHRGVLDLRVGDARQRVVLDAPGGILLPPDVQFEGAAQGSAASASIVHFTSEHKSAHYMFVRPDDRPHAQNLVVLSLDYARRGEARDKRLRLLEAILDCFAAPDQMTAFHSTRVDRAWREAEGRLSQVRGLADVAQFVGLAESTFRAAHRKQFGNSAGQHLQHLRLSRAAHYLATTGYSLREIAFRVGYGHPETLSAAFVRSKSQTPGQFRRWSQRFA